VLPPRGLLRTWGARYQGQIIAVGLHWHAIATAAREGLQVFNSEASRIPSIDHFKETFNPVRERRSTLIRAPGPLWTMRRYFIRWNKAARHLRSRLSPA
jgi:hypothetical protein